VNVGEGPHWEYQICAHEGSVGWALALEVAIDLARRTDGVVWNPQEERVEWPLKGHMRSKRERAKRVDVLGVEWFLVSVRVTPRAGR
jgi:hypothetical protein